MNLPWFVQDISEFVGPVVKEAYNADAHGLPLGPSYRRGGAASAGRSAQASGQLTVDLDFVAI